jgi:Ca-activated chloride channel family protein
METERYPHAPRNPVVQVAEAPVSTFSIDVDTAAYANVRRFLNDGEAPPTDAVRVEELVNYFDYGYPKPASRTSPFTTTVAVVPSPWSPGRQILHIGLQGYSLPSAQRPPLNLVFLIDTSGSMQPDDRLPLARKSLEVLISQLRPQDHVAMVAYAGSAGVVLAPTGGAQKLKMRCALESLDAGGSTAGGAGLKLAYALAKERFVPGAVNRVVLMTDGDFNVGVADPEKLKDLVADQRKSGVYLSVYGFGRGNYQDRTMQSLAQNGNGTAGYVDSLTEARKLFHDDFTRSLFPIADDVKVQVEFNPRAVREYRLIGYETRLLAREDFNNDQVDAGEVGSGAAVTALYEISLAGGPSAVDALRYGAKAMARPPGGEFAFLKIRYKPPHGQASRLITRPITAADRRPTLVRAPEATRWAIAVASFGQKLRRDPHVTADLGWDDIAQLAQGARGEDADGRRAEFVQLVHKANHLEPLRD